MGLMGPGQTSMAMCSWMEMLSFFPLRTVIESDRKGTRDKGQETRHISFISRTELCLSLDTFLFGYIYLTFSIASYCPFLHCDVRRHHTFTVSLNLNMKENIYRLVAAQVLTCVLTFLLSSSLQQL